MSPFCPPVPCGSGAPTGCLVYCLQTMLNASPSPVTEIPHELAVMAEQCTGRGARGVVCAAAPLAAQAGAEVLREGGDAHDAVVAMALAEGVLLPPKCGLGGDLVAVRLAPG